VSKLLDDSLISCLDTTQIDTCTVTEEGIGISVLDYWNLRLTGRAPRCVGDMISMTRLDLIGNRLSGSLPSELVKLTALQDLLLQGNTFSGTMPHFIANMTSLVRLDLFNVRFLPGSIPSTWGDQLSNLKTLTLGGYSGFSGTIPPALSQLQLQTLNVLESGLSGIVPSWLGEMSA
jgi:Leucine-rich repeat (LRR) protein